MADFCVVGAAPSRLIAKRPRVFFDCAIGNAGLNADSVPALTHAECGAKLLPRLGAERRPSQVFTLRASAFEPGLGALTDLLPLKLGERRENREKDIAEQPTELLALVGTLGAALVVDIFAHHHVPHAVAPCAKLQELVLGVLALAVGRDPRVDRD